LSSPGHADTFCFVLNDHEVDEVVVAAVRAYNGRTLIEMNCAAATVSVDDQK
jgi:hypothetical protein